MDAVFASRQMCDCQRMTIALAGHGRRIAAALLDFLYSSLLIGACVAIGFGVGLAGAGADGRDDGWEELGWILLGSFVGLMIGAILWLALTVWLVRRPGPRNGQTLGKQTVGIRAVRADGAAIGVGTALLREVVAKGLLIWLTSGLISGFLGFFDGGAIGAVVAIGVWYGPALFDEQRRGLHDRLCSTRVVLAGRHAAAPPAAAADAGADPDADLWATTPPR